MKENLEEMPYLIGMNKKMSYQNYKNIQSALNQDKNIESSQEKNFIRTQPANFINFEQNQNLNYNNQAFLQQPFYTQSQQLYNPQFIRLPGTNFPNYTLTQYKSKDVTNVTSPQSNKFSSAIQQSHFEQEIQAETNIQQSIKEEEKKQMLSNDTQDKQYSFFQVDEYNEDQYNDQFLTTISTEQQQNLQANLLKKRLQQMSQEELNKYFTQKQFEFNEKIFNQKQSTQQQKRTHQFIMKALDNELSKLNEKASKLEDGIQNDQRSYDNISSQMNTMNKELQQMILEKKANNLLKDIEQKMDVMNKFTNYDEEDQVNQERRLDTKQIMMKYQLDNQLNEIFKENQLLLTNTNWVVQNNDKKQQKEISEYLTKGISKLQIKTNIADITQQVLSQRSLKGSALLQPNQQSTTPQQPLNLSIHSKGKNYSYDFPLQQSQTQQQQQQQNKQKYQKQNNAHDSNCNQQIIQEKKGVSVISEKLDQIQTDKQKSLIQKKQQNKMSKKLQYALNIKKQEQMFKNKIIIPKEKQIPSQKNPKTIQKLEKQNDLEKKQQQIIDKEIEQTKQLLEKINQLNKIN